MKIAPFTSLSSVLFLNITASIAIIKASYCRLKVEAYVGVNITNDKKTKKCA
jgi:hypothetical protein